MWTQAHRMPRGDTDTEGSSHVGTEQTEARLPQAKECGGHQQREEARKDPPSRRQGEHGTASALVWDFQASRTLGQEIAVLSHSVCGAFLRQPQETNTTLNWNFIWCSQVTKYFLVSFVENTRQPRGSARARQVVPPGTDGISRPLVHLREPAVPFPGERRASAPHEPLPGQSSLA